MRVGRRLVVDYGTDGVLGRRKRWNVRYVEVPVDVFRGWEQAFGAWKCSMVPPSP